MPHGLTAAAIWWALRTARYPSPTGPATPIPETLLKATVASPRPLALSEIKAVADGVVAAAQWTRTIHQAGVDSLLEKLNRVGISTDYDVVAKLLRDSHGAGAGLCRDGLIAKDGRVDPDDHLVVAGLIRVSNTTEPGISITAAMFSAEPVS